MEDYISEAEALSEIYDDFEGSFEPLTKSDRRDYVDAKSKTFRKSDIGKWVVIQKPRRNRDVVNVLYLVNRSLTKRFWWSPDASYALVFEKKSAAKTCAEKYSFNKANVKQITPSMANKQWFSMCYE